jgi:hypothetical protein
MSTCRFAVVAVVAVLSLSLLRFLLRSLLLLVGAAGFVSLVRKHAVRTVDVP